MTQAMTNERKASTGTRRARKASGPIVSEKRAPETDLSAYASKEPSAINKAEAEWLIACVGLELTDAQRELAAKFVQLTAGTAHRAWQASAAAKKAHGDE